MPWRNEWREQEEIGRGGQGILTELRGQTGNPRSRAVLKQIVPRWREDQQAQLRLHKEVEVLTKLHDLGARVPEVYDSFAKHDKCEPFVVMEYIPGIPFDKWLTMEAPVSPSVASDITLRIAETLELCHKHSIGHRDLKPANIILKDDSIAEPYILDFGISFDSRQTYILTREGEMFWNEFLILPECQDLEGDHRDLRSDIAALVGIFYSCITGKPPVVLRDALERPPHRRQNEAKVRSIAENPQQAEQLLWFFDKGFSFRLSDRFQSLDEFRREVERFGESGTHTPLDVLEQFQLLDQTVRARDRTVQLALLRENFAKIQKTIDGAMGDLGKGLKSNGGSLQPRGIQLQKQQQVGLPAVGELFNRDHVRAYSISREHFQQTATVLLGPLAVQMQIHLYIASYTGLAGKLDENARSLNWSKVLVIDEGLTSLDKSQKGLVVQALQTSLAEQIRRLAQQPPEDLTI